MKIYTNNIIINTINNIVENEKIQKDFRWHYLFIVSHIRTAPFFDRNMYNNGYSNVNLDTLRKLVSFDYAKIFIDDLINHGVIESDNLYIKGVKSKGYRLTEKYMSEKFKLVEIEDVKLNTKLELLLKKDKNDLLLKMDGYGYVTKWMEELELDRTKALRFIRERIEKSKTRRIDFCKMVVDIFDNKFAKKDDTGNRLHNNLTNAPTEFRQYLKVNGEKLAQCDIKNSQPVFLYCFLREHCHVNEAELAKYHHVVCEYGFYEFFAEKMNKKLTEKNRSSFKKKIFSGVLFDINRKELSDYEEAFKTEFPEIFYVVRNIKTKNYKDVAIMLQKTESKFIFSCIEKLMFDTKNTIPLFTIHDSIATTKECIDLVEKVMIEKFEKDLTVKPQIKKEIFA